MKAIVIYQKDGRPQCADLPEPTIQHDDELLISVKAAAIKHFDKSTAGGTHYAAKTDRKNARVIGGDGVGVLADGTRIFALGISGMIAEKATVDKGRMVKLPDGIDDAVAAALPNAVAGSAMALRFRAGMKPGETILINGATGFTGKIAMQLAKYYGAKKIIVTGRNAESLQSLIALGADEAISLKQDDEKFISQIKAIHNSFPIDIIIDYLWGYSAELILTSLKGKGTFTHRTRFVSVGAVTGDKIQLSAENLRSTDLQLSGSGLGSWTQEEVKKLFHEIIPETFQLAVENKLKVDIEKIKLTDIEKIWTRQMPDGKRLVVTM